MKPLRRATVFDVRVVGKKIAVVEDGGDGGGGIGCRLRAMRSRG